MSKPKALITAAYSDAELKYLEEQFDVTYCNWMERGHAFCGPAFAVYRRGFKRPCPQRSNRLLPARTLRLLPLCRAPCCRPLYSPGTQRVLFLLYRARFAHCPARRKVSAGRCVFCRAQPAPGGRDPILPLGAAAPQHQPAALGRGLFSLYCAVKSFFLQQTA